MSQTSPTCDIWRAGSFGEVLSSVSPWVLRADGTRLPPSAALSQREKLCRPHTWLKLPPFSRNWEIQPFQALQTIKAQPNLSSSTCCLVVSYPWRPSFLSRFLSFMCTVAAFDLQRALMLHSAAFVTMMSELFGFSDTFGYRCYCNSVHGSARDYYSVQRVVVVVPHLPQLSAFRNLSAGPFLLDTACDWSLAPDVIIQ